MIRPFFMAVKGIFAYKGRSFVAVLGIAIAAFLVISLLAVLYNFKSGLLSQFNGVGARQITVIPGKLLNNQAITSTVSDITSFKPSPSTLTYKDVIDVKKKVAGVAKAAPQSEAVTMLVFKKQALEVVFTGTTPDLPDIFSVATKKGTFLTEKMLSKKEKVVVLGAAVKKTLFGEKNAVGSTVEIRGETYRVVGVLEEKKMFGFNIDDRVYAPYPVVEKATDTKYASMLFFQAKETDKVPQIEQQIDKVIKANHGKKDYNLLKANEAIHLVNMVMKLVTAITISITGVSLIVGGLGIMNVMFLTVKERTREIGIRKAIGAKSWQILLQFLYESVILSVIGAALGLAATYGALQAIHHYFPVLSTNVPVEVIQYTGVFALVAGLVFGILPAIRAVRVQPIEALRYE
jgi:putative ABC transport system permease protein